METDAYTQKLLSITQKQVNENKQQQTERKSEIRCGKIQELNN